MVAHKCDEKELIELLLIKTQQSTPYIVDQLSVLSNQTQFVQAHGASNKVVS